MTFFPSHSFEQYYQAVRRCWRFGQNRKVKVDIVTTEGEADVMVNLQRKAQQAENMFQVIVEEMGAEMQIRTIKSFDVQERMPTWV